VENHSDEHWKRQLTDGIWAGENRTEEVKNFCYLGSIITGMGLMEKDIITRI